MHTIFSLFVFFMLFSNSIICSSEVIFSYPDNITLIGDLEDIKVAYRNNNFYVVHHNEEYLVNKHSTDSYLRSLNSSELNSFKKNGYLKVACDSHGQYYIQSRTRFPVGSNYENSKNEKNITASFFTFGIIGSVALALSASRSSLKQAILGTEEERNSAHYYHKIAAKAGSVIVGLAVLPIGFPIAAATTFGLTAISEVAHYYHDGLGCFNENTG